MKKLINSDSIIGLLIIIMSVFFLIKANEMPDSAARFPKIILFTLGSLGFVLMLKGLRISTKKTFNSQVTISLNSIKNPFIAIALITLYVILIKILGFYVSTAIYTGLFMFFFKEKKIATIFLTALGINLFVYLLFAVQLNVELPKGFLYLLEGLVK